MNKDRMISNFIEMVKIHSPSLGEKEYSDYLIEILKKLGLEIYLDEGYKVYGGTAPTIFAKLKGQTTGEGITLAAHTDVVEPSKNTNPLIDGDIIKTDGTTTLGGDDKAGIASIIEVLRTIIEENIEHEDIYLILTPCEENGMLGSKNINWDNVPKHMIPAKDVIVIDNSGKAGLIAHTAPSRYNFKIIFKGRKAHAGIEPEKGINAIQLASIAISTMKMGRIDELTTSNLGSIESMFPSNVVADLCVVTGEIRGHSIDTILETLDIYEKCCSVATNSFGGEYSFEKICDFPTLKPLDDLKFANKFAKIYEDLGVTTKLQIIGGGSDSNIFAEKGYNSIIVGVGMENVHTVNESLDTRELIKTTEAIIKYIKKI
ncbi:M20/M25/M40 family metallo-hydrolase [Cetobacterium sp. 2A]|uniref:M20/M25/M40 family metallo-hydrolase n=1 Tax=Cetobacterium sp. 2A TaxID=2754723 RepID=UPI00163C5793|nr:M20/M25/M40 family metallo-hydrolase [Cetobacterium sp. 2A]MBC2855192.1 M20/M25/M40 family metallo-hydrolase [Cetobacterium sp. 2A]